MDEKRQDIAQIFRGADGQFYFRIVAANGEPISQSEGYHNHGDAVSVVQQHFPDASLIDLTREE